MEYDGNVIGPRLRELRKSRKLTLDKVSELTGLSISTLKQVEQGGRRLSMASLYLLMTVYRCDANTVLNIPADMSEKHFLEMKLEELPEDKKEKCRELFEQIIEMLLTIMNLWKREIKKQQPLYRKKRW